MVVKDDGGTSYVAGLSVETTVAAGIGMAFTAAETLTDPALSFARSGPPGRSHWTEGPSGDYFVSAGNSPQLAWSFPRAVRS
jgi:hypothetical protein